MIPGLDVLVNNAGMAFKGDAFDENVARTTVRTNYYGTKNVCTHFLPLIKDHGTVASHVPARVRLPLTRARTHTRNTRSRSCGERVVAGWAAFEALLGRPEAQVRQRGPHARASAPVAPPPPRYLANKRQRMWCGRVA